MYCKERMQFIQEVMAGLFGCDTEYVSITILSQDGDNWEIKASCPHFPDQVELFKFPSDEFVREHLGGDYTETSEIYTDFCKMS